MKARQVLAVAVFLALLPFNSAAGQAPPNKFVPFQGTQAFRRLLHLHGLEPVREISGLFDRPGETIAIGFGDLGLLEGFSLADFQRRGGAVLLASDRHFAGRIAGGRLRIAGDKITQEAGHAYQKDYLTCPVIRRFTDRRHPLVRNLGFGDTVWGLACNGPSYLDIRGGPSAPRPLGLFGPRCTLDGIDADNFSYLAASPADAPPEGRAVVLAGHGVFFNGMLAFQDNNNLRFTHNCLNWLGEGPEGKRKYALFIDEGSIVDNFNVPLAVNKLPPFQGLPVPSADVLNQIAHGLEQDNVFNRVLWKWQDDLVDTFGPENLVRPYALLATLALLFLVGLLLFRIRLRRERFTPLVFTNLEPAEQPLSLLKQRRREQSDLGNYRDAVQPLVREWFWTHAGIDPAAWDRSPPPAVTLATPASWWHTWMVRRKLNYLSRLARPNAQERVSKADFMNLAQSLADLAETLSSARLSLRPTAPAPPTRNLETTLG